jgi:LacI family transcriptional regulator
MGDPAARGDVTIGEIARAAHVGTGTVSRVLNGAEHVSAATRARVLAVIRRLDYRPHAGARRLARNTARTLAFVMANRPSMHMYNVTTLNGVMAASVARGYSVVYTHFDYGPRRKVADIALPPIVQERGAIDGLILVGINHRNMLDHLARLEIPFVLHQAGYSGDPRQIRGGDAVGMEDGAGTERATAHLLSLGHRRVCFVGDVALPWFRRRWAGYRRAVRAAGRTPLMEWDGSGGDSFDGGAMSAERLLGGRRGCTAIVAGDDLVMLGVLDTLRRRGVTVPGEMSLVGFGDTPELRYQQSPTLSTIRAPRFEIGARMVTLLLERLDDRRLPPRYVSMPTELVVRGSIGPVPRAAATVA